MNTEQFNRTLEAHGAKMRQLDELERRGINVTEERRRLATEITQLARDAMTQRPHHEEPVGVVYSSTGYKVLFYEDPEFGDEVELLALVSGQLVRTDWFDLPGRFELDDWLKDLGVY